MATSPVSSVNRSRITMTTETVPAHQLDFYQAMADFRHMFPNMEEEVIEAVLRSNNGAVDATIDQLLTMNTDVLEEFSQSQETKRPSPANEYRPSPGVNSHVAESSSSEEEDAPPPYPPPSYHDYTNTLPAGSVTMGTEHIAPPLGSLASPGPSSLPGGDQGTPGPSGHPSPLSHPGIIGPPGTLSHPGPSSKGTADLMSESWRSDPLSWSNTTPSKSLLPPSGQRASLLDDPLPADTDACPGYTATDGCPSYQASVGDVLGAVGGAGAIDVMETRPKRAPTDFYGDSPSGGSPAHYSSNSYTTNAGERAPRHVWKPPLLGDLPDDFLRIVPTASQLAGMSLDGGVKRRASESSPIGSGRSSPLVSDRRRSPRRSASLQSPRTGVSSPAGSRRLNSDMEMLQQKLAENERRRQESISGGVPVHPEEAQLLEDERIALVLQNEEFLQELRDDEDFMQTLENDRSEKQDGHHDSSDHLNATAFEPLPVDEPELDHNRPKSEQLEGYGDDREKSLDAFPFDRDTVAAETDRNAELRRKLKNMGGTSKKKLVAAARKFFSRKKKKPSKQLMKGSSIHSTVNLLEEETSDTEEILTSRTRSPYDQGE